MAAIPRQLAQPAATAGLRLRLAALATPPPTSAFGDRLPQQLAPALASSRPWLPSQPLASFSSKRKPKTSRSRIAEAAQQRLKEDEEQRRERSGIAAAERVREVEEARAKEREAREQMDNVAPPTIGFVENMLKKFGLNVDRGEHHRSLSEESPFMSQRLLSRLLRFSDRQIDRVEERQVGLINEL